MSSMLEQAIVDAAALREAAIQSAEQAVVEQYSNQIKETVEQLLEQDELGGMDLGAGMDLGGEMDLGGGEAPAAGAPTPDDIAKDADTKQAAATGGIGGPTFEAFYESIADAITRKRRST